MLETKSVLFSVKFTDLKKQMQMKAGGAHRRPGRLYSCILANKNSLSLWKEKPKASHMHFVKKYGTQKNDG